jgi:hypothetical protein
MGERMTARITSCVVGAMSTQATANRMATQALLIAAFSNPSIFVMVPKDHLRVSLGVKDAERQNQAEVPARRAEAWKRGLRGGKTSLLQGTQQPKAVFTGWAGFI